MNKTYKIIITVFLILLLVVLLFVLIYFHNSKSNIESNPYQETIGENVTINLSYDGVLNDKEYEEITSYIGDITDIPDNFTKIAKLTLNLENNSPYTLSGLISSVNNENLYMIPECTELEPSSPIESKSNITVNTYVYFNEELDTKSEVENILKNTDFNFLFYIENDNEPLNPYEVTVQAVWN